MIEAIGGNITTENQQINNSSIGQEEFIRLFLTQLTNQDPLEPVDNSQFLAQMAQFTSLEQTRLLNENMNNLLAMNSTNQGVNMLGKQVEVINGNALFNGTVEGLQFGQNGISLTVRGTGDEFLSDVSLTDIRLIRE
ncbi:flagellar hook assembly protein FlgD [Agaribacter marinus]|uniref:Basal-body rod modification protein FlgD n=1 Tax=Agaribacter marinus TaxID=1431249 RepID=A0AA37SWJ7_9ALTE|nr:flagellar hook capping FlgD N-terminal domain-containing protein [Agaribacter marinus]GLR70019.1 flagellar hook capping protein [Agaribacter marinus]